MTTPGHRKPLRVGVAQFDAVSGDFAANVAAHVGLIDEAGTQGADLLVFPELSLPGYAADILPEAPERCVLHTDSPALDPLRDACRKAALVAVVGACLESPGGLGLCALAIDRRGENCARYQKQHLDSVEQQWFVPGNTACLIELDGWRLALGICYDASFPEHGRAGAIEGADAYLVSGAFPLGESDHRRTIYFPARALENTCYVAFANYAGAHGGMAFCGHSALYGPDGRQLADMGPTRSGVVVTAFESDVLQQTRDSLQMLRDRRPEPPELQLRIAE